MEKGWERRGARDIGPRRRRERAGVATAEVAEVGMRCKEVGAALEGWGRAAVPTRNNLPAWAGGTPHKNLNYFFLFFRLILEIIYVFFKFLHFDVSVSIMPAHHIIEAQVLFNSNFRYLTVTSNSS